jgi:quinol monooxygenase YgiN
MPYVHQIEFGVRPEKMDLWIPHAHNNLSVMARQEGLLCMRVYRDRSQPTRFFSLRVWRSKEDSLRALASPEVKLATSTNPAHGMSEGFTRIEHELVLLDHVFGRKGVRNFLHPGTGFAHHLWTNVLPENLERWTPYRRNCASIMARHNGVTSYEIMQDTADPTMFLVLRNYENDSFAHIMRGGATPYRPTQEVQYTTKPARDFEVYKGSKPVVYTDCDLFDGVLGPNAAEAYQEFMENLEPV